MLTTEADGPLAGDEPGALLAHSSPLYRAGCRQALAALPGLCVVGEVGRSDAAYVAFMKRRPRVCLVEYSLPPAGGVEFMRRCLARDSRSVFVVLGVGTGGSLALRLLKLGAAACLRHDCALEELAEAVSEATAGRHYLSHDLAQEAALANIRGRDDPDGGPLTPREHEIFRMVSSGMTAAEIAGALSLSVRSVANCTGRIKKKLGATSMADLVHIALRTRLGGSGD